MNPSSLAQSSLAVAVDPRSQDTVRLIVLIVMLGIAFLIMGAFLLAIRKNFLSAREDYSSEPLSLHDVREMHKAGKITDEEFEEMKRLVLPAKREVHPEAAALKREKPDGSGEA